MSDEQHEPGEGGDEGGQFIGPDGRRWESWADFRAYAAVTPDPGALTEAERSALESQRGANGALDRLLDLYDRDRARLTVIGGDMMEAWGGYDCAGLSTTDFDGGALSVSRTNIRQAVDALEEHFDAGRTVTEPWWVRVNRQAESDITARLDAPDDRGGNRWSGPVYRTASERAAREAADPMVPALLEERDRYRTLWRAQDSQIRRVETALGVPDDGSVPLDQILLDRFSENLDPRLQAGMRALLNERAAEDARIEASSLSP